MHKSHRIFVVTALATLLCATAGSAARAQLAPTASLSDELTAQYKLTKLGVDSTGITVTDPGTVLMVQKGGVLGFPPTDVGVLPTKFENGSIHSPNPVLTGVFKQNVSTRFLTAGERVYVTKLDVNMKAAKITFSLVECDTCNGVQNPSNYKAVLAFQFAKGSLESANPADIENTIAQVLAVDSDSNQGGGDQGGQAASTAATGSAATAATTGRDGEYFRRTDAGSSEGRAWGAAENGESGHEANSGLQRSEGHTAQGQGYGRRVVTANLLCCSDLIFRQMPLAPR